MELLPPGETILPNDEIILENNETLDISQNVKTVTESTENIGGQNVTLTQQVIFTTSDGEVLILENTSLTNVTVEIPDQTAVSAPSAWDNTIQPPKQIATSGTVAAGFQSPTTSISVGSPDVILVFDKAVTLVLEGTTGQTAYKLSGTTNWVLISGCTGTYDNPDDPPVNGECSISNGVDTKILTYHFTEFAELEEEETVDETIEQTTTSSGGSGRTGVGPHGTGSSSSSTIQDDTFFFVEPGAQNFYKFPVWFKNVIDWKSQGLINDTEYTEAYQWMINNIVK